MKKKFKRVFSALLAVITVFSATAVFGTSTKSDAVKMSFETLKQICESVKIPVTAIGGITKENVLQLKGTGISGVAVVSGIFAEKDIYNSTAELRKKIEEVVNEK